LDSGLTGAMFCCWICEGGRTLNCVSGMEGCERISMGMCVCVCVSVCEMEEGHRLESFTQGHA